MGNRVSRSSPEAAPGAAGLEEDVEAPTDSGMPDLLTAQRKLF